jgi:formylglycine-generating enzyme required for sulfatase activity
MIDFFISYHQDDQSWAEWISWTLEEASYSVVIDTCDSHPGRISAIESGIAESGDESFSEGEAISAESFLTYTDARRFVMEQQRLERMVSIKRRTFKESRKTIVLLSESHLEVAYSQLEWAASFTSDPLDLERKVIPVRIQDCQPTGLLGSVTYVDLVGLNETEARDRLLSALKQMEKSAKQSEPERINEFLFLKCETRTTQFLRQKINDTVSLDMVLIPGGSFVMGSPEDEIGHTIEESPQHVVTVPSFCLGKHPVTQTQYQAVIGTNPSSFRGSDRPVENISWEDAVKFCEQLSQLTEQEYRLPSEAEWEYACRAGTTTPFHFGETITADLANYDGTDKPDGIWSGSYGRGPKGTQPQETTMVGRFPPNAFGLYDMHGNIWEWCLDHWHNNYEGAPIDGSAWLRSNDISSSRVLRGGSWSVSPRYCRSAYRNFNPPILKSVAHLGFRVVCPVPQKT